MSHLALIHEQNGYNITSYGIVIAYLFEDDGWKCEIGDGFSLDIEAIEFINKQMVKLTKTTVIEILAKMTVVDEQEGYNKFKILDTSPHPNVLFLSQMDTAKLFAKIDKTMLGDYIVEIKIEYIVNAKFDYTVSQFTVVGKLA